MSTRVLLIEDAADTIGLIANILEEEESYNLSVATDGEAGLLAARAERPDVILLDMSLPRLSGWDLAPRLRAEGVAIPIIAITAHAMRDDRGRALAAGCTDYISKPFEIAALLAMLARYAPRA